MCTSPIKIKNRSLDPLADKYLYVPCGKCLSCKKSKADSIEYRAIKEYDWCISQGGRAYMITFTYDDEHLPRARAFKATRKIGNKFVGIDYESSNSVRDIKCWRPELTADLKLKYPPHKDFYCHNKRDLQLFNKKLRSRLKYYGYDVEISYFIASEYGSTRLYSDSRGRARRATCRPHYHAMYFLYPRSIGNVCTSVPSEIVFLNFAYDCWRKCSPKNFKNVLIDNKISSAIGYVAKYINKDDSYKEFGKRVFDVPCTYGLFKDGVLELVEESQIAPFTLISKNFGVKHLLSYSIPRLIDFCSKNVSIVNNNGSVFSFPCPVYYKKKFLYKTEEVSETYTAVYSVESYLPNCDNLYNIVTILLNETETHYNSKKIEEYFDTWLDKQIAGYKTDYDNLVYYWYSLENKPFSDSFLKYGLFDYLVNRFSYVDILSGEIIDNLVLSYPDGNLNETFLSDLIINMCCSVSTKKEHLEIRQSIEDFIQSYRKIINDYRSDRLLVSLDKSKKRAAERKYSSFNNCANETTLKTLIRSHSLRRSNLIFNSKS